MSTDNSESISQLLNDGSHTIQTVPGSGKNGQGDYHVFALHPSPVNGKQDVQINIPVGPATLQYSGVIDIETLSCDIIASIKLPFLPEFRIGQVIRGNLKEGITIQSGLSVASGSTTLYAQDSWLWNKFKLTILGKTYDADFKLIPLPLNQVA